MKFPAVPVLAEIGDKIPRLPVLVLWCVGICLLAWVLGRRTKWLGLLTLPIAFLYAIGVTAEPLDSFVGPAIIHELGYYYPFTCFALALIPFAIMAIPFFKTESNKAVQRTRFARR